MTLIELIASLDEVNDDATIYALEPWSHRSVAIIAMEPLEGGLPVEAKQAGLSYFLEVDVAREVLESLQDSSSARVTDGQRCDRVIHYAINDA